ncbi:MAG: SMI1/KNR4 family protein [Parvibaculum sp.]|uniref:SMI1/KNR4 family protein n=1 Tax=Parvibaculum sp. TaxID=2024848 RepID=UPI0027233C23|nr:SMI1/KNR4 family protein [Parvibaculum sp.]MDO8839074.1 SMI1/KNR4 family protein [Parvibaculum sp.]
MLQDVVEPNATIGEIELRSFADRHGIRLPKAYAEFLLRTNGGQPVPAAFPIAGMEGNPSGVIQAFFGLKANIGTEDLESNLTELGETVPMGILPIAGTEGDDFLILDLRKKDAPVLFWDRKPFWGSNLWDESDLYPVAADFELLLRELHEL